MRQLTKIQRLENRPSTATLENAPLSACRGSGQLIVAEDLNATGRFDRRFGMRAENTNVTELLTNVQTDNGKLWAEYTRDTSLALVNTFHEHKAIHRHTWYHANRAICFSKTIDYVAQSKWLANFCQDARVKRDFYSSDRRLLVARMATPGS